MENAAEDQYEEDSDSDNGEIDETSREVIKIVNVHKTYLLGIEGVPALRGVNVTVQEGEFISSVLPVVVRPLSSTSLELLTSPPRVMSTSVVSELSSLLLIPYWPLSV